MNYWQLEWLLFILSHKALKLNLLHYCYLKPIERPIVFEGKDMVWDGEEVTVCSHQCSEVKSFHCEQKQAKTDHLGHWCVEDTNM